MLLNRQRNIRPLVSGWVTLLILLFIAAPPALANRSVQNGDTIEIHYTGKLKDNSVFDKSEGKPPLKFTVGTNQVITGMDNAVLGMKVGDSKTVSIPPKEAYGQYDDKKMIQVPKDKLPPGVKIGDQLVNQNGRVVVVKTIGGEYVTLDVNHVLAGKTLIFDIKLVSIK